MRLRLFGLTLVISYPLVCAMTVVVLIDRSMTVVICFAAALMHELGHILMLRHYHAMPQKICLSLFDIAIVDKKRVLRPDRQELAVILAGITINFLSAAVGGCLFRLTGVTGWQTFCTAHLTLGLFNALPVDSLDGGQALMLLLSRRISPQAAERFLTVLSLLLLLPMGCIGLLTVLRTPYQFTLLTAALYLAAALLLKRRKAGFGR